MSVKFAVGDVVQLKSGGPLLTVLIAGAKEVTAVFYRESDGSFPSVTLATAILDKIELDDDIDDEIED